MYIYILGATDFVQFKPKNLHPTIRTKPHRMAHSPDLILLVDSRNDWPVADVISAGAIQKYHHMIYKLGVS